MDEPAKPAARNRPEERKAEMLKGPMLMIPLAMTMAGCGDESGVQASEISGEGWAEPSAADSDPGAPSIDQANVAETIPETRKPVVLD